MKSPITSTRGWTERVLGEWLLLASASALVVTSVMLGRWPVVSVTEFEVVILLWALFVAIKGLENGGLLLRLSHHIDKGRLIPLKLVAATFVLSAIVTNDVALVVVVPVTLSLGIKKKGTLVVLEALAANAGSALTPFGNPQNLFIYWFYDVSLTDFVASIAPLAFFLLALLLIGTVFVRADTGVKVRSDAAAIDPAVFLYGGFLIVVILTVLRVLPAAAGLLVLIYAAVFDRKALRVDNGLLVTFVCLAALANNVGALLATDLRHAGHTFLLAALSSQIIGNVPATMLIAKFTTHWEALLWGVSVGGFGSLVASFANLIAYRLYVVEEGRNRRLAFTAQFMGVGFVMFLAGTALYFIRQV
ncbi:MAG: hypothetical protein GXP34_06780 [Actinobacteria bacterium]|nr:hypothetical protein [Actinomycetota bacterium]